jgi:HSP20 family protein
MTRQQRTPAGTLDPNQEPADASAPGATSAGTASHSSDNASIRSTSGGNTGAAKIGPVAASTGNRKSQTHRRDTERSIPKSQEGMQRPRSDDPGRQAGARSRAPALTRFGLPPGPWELMRRLTEDLNRAAESLREARAGASMGSQRFSSRIPANSSGTSTGLTDATAWIPDVEVLRQPNSLVVRVDLPGIAPEEIDISIEDGLLTIAGERTQERRDEEGGVVRTERSYGSFLRSIVLPDGADESRIEAKADNGVLEINVPIAGGHRSRRIPVKS